MSCSVVVVDARELRSALPRALHESQHALRVATLATADYVLAEGRIGVERKAIETSDLQSSLESGRLFAQLVALVRSAFELPVLLVEYPDGDAHSLVEDRGVSDDVSPRSVHGKLALTAMRFPSVRFCWSVSPDHSVALFEALVEEKTNAVVSQKKKKKPDATDDDELLASRRVLEKLPGVRRSAVPAICEAVGSLRELAGMSVEALTPLLGGSKRDARLLYAFFREPLPDDDPENDEASESDEENDPR